MSTEVATATTQFAPALGAGFADPLATITLYANAIDTAYNLAVNLCRTPLAGPVYRGKPHDAAVAILYGAEIGLNPIQSLQQIFTVHGTPAIYARTMVALLKRRGCRFQTVESSPTVVTVSGTSPNGDSETSTWTIDRADKAGYVPHIDTETGKFATNKNGNQIGNEKYLTQPEEMLYAKAAATVCRRLAPDVLLGISRTSEDLESEPAPAVHVVSERVSAADVLGTTPSTDEQPVVVVEWSTTPSESSDAPADVEAVLSEPSIEPEPMQASEPGSPADPPSSRIQQKKIARLLTERAVEDADKLLAIGQFLGREIASADDISRDEGIRLLAHLEGASEVTGAVTAEGGAQ